MPKALPSLDASVHPTLSLTPEALQRLLPFEAELRQHLAAGADFESLADNVARRAQVNAAQAELFAQNLQ